MDWDPDIDLDGDPDIDLDPDRELDPDTELDPDLILDPDMELDPDMDQDRILDPCMDPDSDRDVDTEPDLDLEFEPGIRNPGSLGIRTWSIPPFQGLSTWGDLGAWGEKRHVNGSQEASLGLLPLEDQVRLQGEPKEVGEHHIHLE